MNEIPQTRLVNNTVMYLVSASQANAYFTPHYARGQYVYDCPIAVWCDLNQHPFRYRG